MGAMDDLISPALVAQMRAALRSVAPAMDTPNLAHAETAVLGASLRRRVDIVRDALLDDLPAGFAPTEEVVLYLLGEPRFAGWMIWPTTEVVAARALGSGSEQDFDSGMALLARLTTGLTSEFAIRGLLAARPERALAIMQTWTTHDDEHVRRLATEGSRAYLPWAKRVPWLLAHPRATEGILDGTYRDPSEYVRRSVANHLNDLSRIDSAVVVDIGKRWAGDPNVNTPWVLRHGLRTLAKRADPGALALLGFSGDELDVERPQLSRGLVPWGEEIAISAQVRNHGSAEALVAIDYSIGFQRANGSVSPKTFKLAVRRIPPGDTVIVDKTFSFRRITTRTYYPGRHYVAVQANGVVSEPADFVLDDPRPSQMTAR